MEDEIRVRILQMEDAIKSTSHEGVVYEDRYVIVERKDGQVVTTGKPLRVPFIYE